MTTESPVGFTKAKRTSLMIATTAFLLVVGCTSEDSAESVSRAIETSANQDGNDTNLEDVVEEESGENGESFEEQSVSIGESVEIDGMSARILNLEINNTAIDVAPDPGNEYAVMQTEYTQIGVEEGAVTFAIRIDGELPYVGAFYEDGLADMQQGETRVVRQLFELPAGTLDGDYSLVYW